MTMEEKAYEQYRLQWMLDHGHTIPDLIEELDKMKEDSDPDASISELFYDWEYGFGFSSDIWASFDEFLECELEEYEQTHHEILCPHCGEKIQMTWDSALFGHNPYCPYCGNQISLKNDKEEI